MLKAELENRDVSSEFNIGLGDGATNDFLASALNDDRRFRRVCESWRLHQI